MQLIEKLIDELDTVAAAAANVKVFTLKRASAVLTANLIRQLFLGTTTGGAGGGAAFGGGGGGGAAGGAQNTIQTRPLLTSDGTLSPGATLVGLQLAVDDRTNSIVVAGSETDLDTIRGLIAHLESQNIEDRLIEVYKLQNAAAADVYTALNAFIKPINTLSTATGNAGGTFYTAFQQIQRNVVLQAEPVSNTLLISATPKLFAEMKRVIERWTRSRRRLRSRC